MVRRNNLRSPKATRPIPKATRPVPKATRPRSCPNPNGRPCRIQTMSDIYNKKLDISIKHKQFQVKFWSRIILDDGSIIHNLGGGKYELTSK